VAKAWKFIQSQPTFSARLKVSGAESIISRSVKSDKFGRFAWELKGNLQSSGKVELLEVETRNKEDWLSAKGFSLLITHNRVATTKSTLDLFRVFSFGTVSTPKTA